MEKPILTNFNAPYLIRKRFDAVCHSAGRTRTSVLIEMMEGYVVSQASALAAKAQQLREVDRIIEENRESSASNEYLADDPGSRRRGVHTPRKSIFEPLAAFMDDGLDHWS